MPAPLPTDAPSGKPAPAAAPVRTEPPQTQKAAQTLFEAKQRAQRPHSSLPWLLSLGALLLTGGVGYVYWQMQGAPLPGSSTSSHPAPPATPAATSSPDTPVSPAAAPAVAPPPAERAPGTPAPTAGPSATPISPAAPAAGQSLPGTTPAGPLPAGQPEPALAGIAPPARSDSGITIRRGSSAVRVNPTVSAAYEAFSSGDLPQAETLYRKALQADRHQRDALLGLAAIAVRRNLHGDAAALYQRLLEIDPRDTAAQAGLADLQLNADPVAGESRIKLLLTQEPRSPHLNFALGNLYAAQSRWSEAQQAYFNAYSAAPNQADYAFNLAVSLDHLGQYRIAVTYYRKSLELAAQRSAAFDTAQVKARLDQLGTP